MDVKNKKPILNTQIKTRLIAVNYGNAELNRDFKKMIVWHPWW